MKKSIITGCIGILLSAAAFAQPVSDRAVVPIGVTLNQVLRLHVISGGNIEFVFNTIADYKNGMNATAAAAPFFTTTFQIASSTSWQMKYGAEDATLVATDNRAALTAFNLKNIGYKVTNIGTNKVEDTGGAVVGATTDLIDDATTNFNGLEAYPVTLMAPKAGSKNGGDVAQNSFSMLWQCGVPGITGTHPTLGTSILSQNLTPDRYVTNVLFEIDSVTP